MSTFATREFKVIPKNKFFPNVEDGGGDDPPKYTCEAVISGHSTRSRFIENVGRGTAERILGTRTWNWHHESGQVPTTLTVPVYGGTLVTFTKAILTSITNIEGYGDIALEQFKCSLEFTIVSDLTP